MSKICSFSLIMICLISNISSAGTLVINSMHSDPTAKKAFKAVIDNFEKEYPNIKVKVNTTSHESYKVQIRTWLPNKAPDIATWFAGNRAKFFVEKGLIEPIDDVWEKLNDDFPEGIKKAVTFNGKKYLLPTSYYHWGFYYRKDLFKAANITPPETWEQFLKVVKTLKKNNITPVTIGTKNAWPSAAWFDFINMRKHGYDYHMDLMQGKIKYTEQKVVDTMSTWEELLKLEAFNKSHPSLSWQEAMALMWQGKAAMYLMGNFITTEIPSNLQDKVGFFRFPKIGQNQKLAEVAPTDVYFIPAKAKNKPDAKKFIGFLARPTTQELINGISRLIPPNIKSNVDNNDPFLKAGVDTLKSASEVSQFFDRDAHPQVAKAGMDGFVEFMLKPANKSGILEKIEKVRKRVHR